MVRDRRRFETFGVIRFRPYGGTVLRELLLGPLAPAQVDLQGGRSHEPGQHGTCVNGPMISPGGVRWASRA